MKKIIALVLALCMLVGSVAVAQSDSPYVPGALRRQLFMDALNAGLIVSCDLNVSIDMNPMLLTDDPNEAEIIAAVFETIGNAHLRFGAGKAGEGFRIELGATLDSANGGAPASVDFAANVDWDTISIESDLLPGQRVTMQWESLLALAGADDETIAAFKELRNIDLNEAMNDFFAQLQEEFAALGAILAPYGEIIVNHFSTWEASLDTDVPADDRYPAAAERLTVTVSTHDLAALITDLLDRAEADGLLDEANAKQVADLRSNLERLDSVEGVYTLRMGVDENELPLYFAAYVGDDESTSSAVISLVFTPMAEEATGAVAYNLSLNAYSRDGNGLVDTLSAMDMVFAVDPSDPVLAASAGLSMTLDASNYGETFYALDYTVTTVGETTEDGMPAAHTTLSETVVSDLRYTVMRTIAAFDSVTSLTADGGEGTQMTGKMELYAGNDEMFSAPFVISETSMPDGNGGIAGDGIYAFSIPRLGVEQIVCAMSLFSKTYDPDDTAALEEIAFEEISNEQFEMLVNSLQANVMTKVFTFMAAMPQSVMNVLMAE